MMQATDVRGHVDSSVLNQPCHQHEVASGVLLRAQQCVGYSTGDVVYRQRWGQPRSLALQPPMAAAVALDQHSLRGHPLPSDRVTGRPALPLAG